MNRHQILQGLIMERYRPPMYVLVISLLGAILVILAAIAFYQTVRVSWSISYGLVLLVFGVILIAISRALTRKKPAKKLG